MSPFGPVAQIFGGGAGKEISVVIADDQPEIRRALRRIIEKDARLSILGEVEDGQEAIRMIAETKPDVVILDLAMPGTNGLQAIPGLCEVSPSTKIVVFSSMVNFNGTRDQALELGAALVLSKDTPPRKLIKALLRVSEAN